MAISVIQSPSLLYVLLKAKTSFLWYIGYLNFIKDLTKRGLLQIQYITNSSSCTTTELPKSLTSCLTTIRKHIIKYCDKVFERSGRNLFWSIKNSNEGPPESYCWFSSALAFKLLRVVESSSLFHLCNLLIFFVFSEM